jgi:hypothetical protein
MNCRLSLDDSSVGHIGANQDIWCSNDAKKRLAMTMFPATFVVFAPPPPPRYRHAFTPVHTSLISSTTPSACLQRCLRVLSLNNLPTSPISLKHRAVPARPVSCQTCLADATSTQSTALAKKSCKSPPPFTVPAVIAQPCKVPLYHGSGLHVT